MDHEPADAHEAALPELRRRDPAPNVVLEPQLGLVAGNRPRSPADDGLAASMRDRHTGRPLTRDELEAFLRTRMAAAAGERLPLLETGEAEAVAALLDKLAACHRGESLGQLARELAVRLYDRMGL
ncbi:hypothetical protein [Nonomuraea diastatica]|uniref:Uncharacterized protein n=1 Tax=Nonomuraea diastatica TaxID=1848329 RepID=A0A4R4W9P6_9ACTN|nr:hypothetical protein [Nonomuraea diastatica]TDD12893.1 hypothetical protein E1294_43160 [Nonomuraea diastatica]